ncbi:Cys-tRNA(Pro) deacylase [Candidatus Albibeggiatoa sp. nov. NOAA]|uniref:Cys-tRNA(Pro) deacylase n=1 Tax=Candidatus Albibeggiatoa sp. nov. NOAA TaxID=3162724 RepID=UPI0033042986|nr:Cys-tRNA(Pro) deacylase [Thiotrichaceae bacterium]
MTPAIKAAQKAKIEYIVHEYIHDSKVDSYGEEAAQALGIDTHQVFKTLLVSAPELKDKVAVGIVPVCGQLDLKAIARQLKAKKVVMANPQEAEKITGYVVGGISPLGQKKRLQMVLDETALNFDTIYVSAGKRGLEIELKPSDLIALCQAEVNNIRK